MDHIPVPGPYAPLTEPAKSRACLPEVISWAQAPSGLRDYLVGRHGETAASKDIPVTPEITSYYLLDYLSGRPGQIRRQGGSYRCAEYDQQVIDMMAASVANDEPIPLFLMAFSPKFRSDQISGGQLLPDASNYLSLLNLHAIIAGARNIYKPGLKISVGYEGTLYRALGRYPQDVITETQRIARELNDAAALRIHGTTDGNPIEIVDVNDLVKKCLIDHPEAEVTLPSGEVHRPSFNERFRSETTRVERRYNEALFAVDAYIAQNAESLITDPLLLQERDEMPDEPWYDFLKSRTKLVPVVRTIIKKDAESQEVATPEAVIFANQIALVEQLESWMVFYRGTMSQGMMPEGHAKEAYIRRMAFRYEAFSKIKYQGGRNNRGIVGFQDHVVAATAINDGKRMGLQLVPGFDKLSHHALTVLTRKGDKTAWRPMTLAQIQASGEHFVPQYVEGYNYPFYYEQLGQVAQS